jgi:tRNA 2-thiouridine synthesizing protein A
MPKETPMQTQTLDCRGLNCPMPVLKTQTAMKALNPGERLTLLATDPGTRADIAAWARRTGNSLLSVVQQERTFLFLLEKAA